MRRGGVALELRLLRNPERARATKDIDVILHDPNAAQADLARELERAAVGGEYQGFIFRRKGEPIYLENCTVSVELAVTYCGGAWTTITVDIAREQPGEEEVELVPAIELHDAVGINGPAELPGIPLQFHIAQKLHAMRLTPGSSSRRRRATDALPGARRRGETSTHSPSPRISMGQERRQPGPAWRTPVAESNRQRWFRQTSASPSISPSPNNAP